MISKSFSPSLIQLPLNPFSSTKAVSISDGVFVGDDGTAGLIQEITHTPLSKMLVKTYDNIIESGKIEHVLLLADYGQGKSFSISHIQNRIISSLKYPIISISISEGAQEYVSEDHTILKTVIACLLEAFEKLPVSAYPNKEAVNLKYNLNKKTTRYQDTLKRFDKAFKELHCYCFIFIDELDKIVSVSDAIITEKSKRLFIEDLKTLADSLSHSVSLLISGTNSVELFMKTQGQDYTQRFALKKFSRMTYKEIDEFIEAQCLNVLKKRSYSPFDSYAKNKIYNVANQNIRGVVSLCHKLWKKSASEKKGIDENFVNNFLEEASIELLKDIFPQADTQELEILSKMIANKSVSTLSIHRTITKPGVRNKIFDFIAKNSDKINRVGRSFMIKPEIRKNVLNSILES